MRRSISRPRLHRLARAIAFACTIALAGTAAAAQPAAPAAGPAPVAAPAPVSAPAPAPAPAPVVVTPAPAPVATSSDPNSAIVVTPTPNASTIIVNNVAPTPAPAPAPAPTPWVIQPIEPPKPPPAPVAPVVPSQMRVDMYPHPMAPPSKEELARLRLVSETSRARGVAVAGWATLGGSYAMSALVGTIAMDIADGDRRRKLFGGWMTIPVGGPFIAAFYARSNTGKLLTASLGVAQGLGLAMGVVGSVRHRRLKRQMTLAAAPLPEGGGAVAVSGRF